MAWAAGSRASSASALGGQRGEDGRGLLLERPQLVEAVGLGVQAVGRLPARDDQGDEHLPPGRRVLRGGVVELLADREGALEVVPGRRDRRHERRGRVVTELGLGEPELLVGVADRVVGLDQDAVGQLVELLWLHGSEVRVRIRLVAGGAALRRGRRPRARRGAEDEPATCDDESHREQQGQEGADRTASGRTPGRFRGGHRDRRSRPARPGWLRSPSSLPASPGPWR